MCSIRQRRKYYKHIGESNSIMIIKPQLFGQLRKEITRIQEFYSVEHTGTLTVYRADEVGSQQITRMAKEILEFGDVVSGKEKNRLLELNAKFEEVLKAYEERGKQIQLLENQISQMDKQLGKRKMGESSKLRTVYPRPLVEPFKSTPIVEIPDTPQRPVLYTTKEFKEERDKLREIHIFN